MSNDSDKSNERVRTLLNQATILLEEVAIEIKSSEIADKREVIREIGIALGHISVAGARLPGGLRLSDEPQTPEPDGELSDEQQARADQLSDEDLQIIDEALLAQCNHQFRKVARIVGFAMMDRDDRYNGIPDILYSQRVTKLVESGRLEHQGRLGYMRFCEVRLPQENNVGEFFPDGEDIPQKEK